MSGLEALLLPIALEVSVMVGKLLLSSVGKFKDVDKDFKDLFKIYYEAQMDLDLAHRNYNNMPRHDEEHSALKTRASMIMGETRNLLEQLAMHFPVDDIDKNAKLGKLGKTKFLLTEKSTARKLGEDVKASCASLAPYIVLMSQAANNAQTAARAATDTDN